MKTYKLTVIRRNNQRYNTFFMTSNLNNCYIKLKEELISIYGESLFEYFNTEEFLELVKLGEVSFGDISLDIDEVAVTNLDE